MAPYHTHLARDDQRRCDIVLRDREGDEMPKSRKTRKKKKRRSSSSGGGGGGSMLSMRSTMKRATGSVSGGEGESRGSRSSNLWSTVVTIALIAAAAAILYWRFLR